MVLPPSRKFTKYLKTSLSSFRLIDTSLCDLVDKVPLRSLTHLNCSGRRRVGNAVFRYHGTSRRCTLGSPGNTRLCCSTACELCSILRTSFKISQSGP